MSGPAIGLVVHVKREQTLDTGTWVWTALPQGYPGSAGGRSIAELHEEVEALKHFITGADPATNINVDYVYEIPGLSRDLLMDYQHGRSHRDEAARAASRRQRRSWHQSPDHGLSTACSWPVNSGQRGGHGAVEIQVRAVVPELAVKGR